MKKFYLILIILAFPTISFATSGACSYHKGVNCSAGASYFGKVQCNDGWINSSVYFSDAVECQKPSCAYPTYSSCDVEYAKQQAQRRAETRSYSVGRSGGNGALLDWTQDLDYILCKDTQALYQIGQDNYNRCLADEFKKSKEETAILEIELQRRLDESCAKHNGVGSVFKDGKCVEQLKITTDSLPNAIVNKPYSADINFIYPGEDTPSLRVEEFPEGLDFNFIKFNGENGIFRLKLIPRKAGKFTFKTKIEVNYIEIGNKTFDLIVDGPVQEITQASATVPVVSIISAPMPTSVKPNEEVIKKTPSVVQKVEISSQKPASTTFDTQLQSTGTTTLSNTLQASTTSQNTVQPAKKLKWYQKIFHWFK